MRKILPLTLLASLPSWALPEGGIPLARGTVWTEEGLGATSSGGVSFTTKDALPMTRMDGAVWYHYRPWLQGGATYNLAMAVPRDEARQFTARYELLLSSMWELGPRMAFQATWLLGGSKRDFYADTAAGAPPVLNNTMALGSGFLGSLGARFGSVVGARLSGGGRWMWWLHSTDGNELEWTWELEPGLSMCLHRFWPRADSLTRAWEVSLRLPMEYTPQQMDLSGLKGSRYVPGSWRAGLAAGLSVVF
ncbi:MAG: hypothetical protein H6686_03495 [Fibrobacteria bacterium]|nr:hypothetical protein [Fibrobacteria bacterium]